MVCVGEFLGSDGQCATDHTDQGRLVLKVAAAFCFRKEIIINRWFIGDSCSIKQNWVEEFYGKGYLYV